MVEMNSTVHIPGLSTQEVIERQKKYGLNTLPNKQRRNIFHLIWDIIKEPMILLLVLAMGLYLLFGDLQEGLSLSIFVLVIISISLYQEGKTEHALQALRELTTPNALVIRNNQNVQISSRDIVVDDIVILYEGDRVPADGQLLSVNDLLIDEALLTGESLPVSKDVQNEYNVFSGTLVVHGQGIFKVQAIGENTAIGKIGIELETLEPEPSPLQHQVAKLVKTLSIIGIIICLTLVVLLGVLKGNWLNASLAGLALAMSLLPEEFAVILTVFPALGAWRLSKEQVLTRRVASIETLGAISILCVDKTGTLTENKMTVSALWATNQTQKINFTQANSLTGEFKILAEYAILASEIAPLDPIEKACHQLAVPLNPEWILVQEYDRTSEFPVKAHIWQNPEQNDDIIAAKGAPEAILSLCHKLSDHEKNEVLSAASTLGKQGLRILAIAKGTHQKSADWPVAQQALSLELLGLVGVSDPIRPNIKYSVQQCYDAGIKIMMITGDFPETAKTIAQQAGIKIEDIITGKEIISLSDAELAERLKNCSICARVTPALKLKIVQALKADNYIVAMTGDGVNDAPALKSAHVGVAMGKRGTDVAREASTIILLDDNFSSIVKAITLGRRIFSNIKKSMGYILAVHIPIAGMALLPVFFGWPILFFPIHIAFLQLVIDPVCSIAFENEPAAPNVMRQPPRNPKKALLNKKTFLYAILQGLGVLTITFFSYCWALGFLPENQARTVAFLSLTIGNLALVYANRSEKSILFSFLIQNKIVFRITLATLIFLSAAIYIPFLQNLFYFEALPTFLLFKSILIGLSSILWFEFLKIILK